VGGQNCERYGLKRKPPVFRAGYPFVSGMFRAGEEYVTERSERVRQVKGALTANLLRVVPPGHGGLRRSRRRGVRALPLAYRQVHLDFHTSEQIPGIGSRFDAEQFAATLEAARVNSITCFSRCHHGLIYHDTRFEARHPHLEPGLNLLQEQISACHARGIRVPVYISVGLDEFMAARHPEWVELGADGKRRGAAPLEAGWKKLCLNSPYVEYVSAQTREVLEQFDVDGLFFDIIHQGQCCCRWCLEAMATEGVDAESEEQRRVFAREVLNRLRRRITGEVRDLNRECTIFWNSGHVDPSFRPVLDTYTHLELESLPSGGWGYDHFPLTVRYGRNLGLDHLGMTGKFHKTWAGFGELKTRAALEFECFTALAEGSKCSIGDQLHPNGELNAATYELIGQIYSAVAAREPWCAGARPVTELAVLTPEALGLHDGRVDTSAGGALRMLLESHHQFDVVDTEMDWSRYRSLILPDKIRLDDALAARVRSYLAGGGAVIASHRSGLRPEGGEGEAFALEELGVRYLREAPFSPDFARARPEIAEGIPDTEHVFYDRGLEVEPVGEGRVLADVWHPYFNRTWEHFCSHRHTPAAGPGDAPAAVATPRTLYFAHPIFGSFYRHGYRPYKQLVLNALLLLLPDPLVETNAPSTARITVTRQETEARTLVHLLHYIPEQRYREIQTIEEAIPLFEVQLAVRLTAAPRRAYLAPEGRELPLEWRNGRACLTVPEVRGYAMVALED
jgi:hypothetical protein